MKTDGFDVSIVFTALLVLKLTVRPDLSWLAVFSPFWLPLFIALILIWIRTKK